MAHKYTRRSMLALMGLSGCAAYFGTDLGPKKMLDTLVDSAPNTDTMPVLFFGHGDPMNAIWQNSFTKGFEQMVAGVPKPYAILCVSAHWQTRGPKATAMAKPKTIHDFGGFPRELYEVRYGASGSPELAQRVGQMLAPHASGDGSIDAFLENFLDQRWGLDHGTWSVLKHAYPDADVPVIQLSLDRNRSPEQHYELAQQLSALREKGVLIVGSGNIVHNLMMLDSRLGSTETFGFDWAYEARAKVNELILSGNHKELIGYQKLGKAVNLAVPTPEHFLPLLYILSLQRPNEQVQLFNDTLVEGSISMTSLRIA